MIGQAIRHGRTARDARNLGAHLLKDAGTRIEMFNSVAPDLYAAMSDMQLARDGSRADSAFLHLSISPARNMNDDELRQVADIVMRHFGAEDHQAVFVVHDKDRSNNKGNSHGHIVLGRVGPDGQVIPSGFEKIRLETAMRIAEFELGEPATLGRHHGSAIKWLRSNGREDVANWLADQHGPSPDKPQSPVTPAKRQQIERNGVDLATVSMTVQSAWQQSDDARAFTAALSESGFDVIAGQKPGVFVVLKNGVEFGALDRLLKLKRRDVSDRMKGFYNEPVTTEIKSDASNESYLSGGNPQQKRDRPVETIAPITRSSGEVRGRANRTDSAIPGGNIAGAAASDDHDGRPRQESRKLDQNKTLISLDKVRLSSTTVILAQEIKGYHKPFSLYELHSAAKNIEAHITGWEWVQTFRDDLLEKIRELKDKILGVEHVTDKPVIKVSKRPYDYHYDNHDDEEYQAPRFG